MQLKKGKIATLFNPHPICYVDDVCDKVPNSITENCSLHGFNFPFKDTIVCNCGHFYHAWSAIIWLKKNTQCNLCGGLVHPNWYKSFGFVEFDNQLENKFGDLECELA